MTAAQAKTEDLYEAGYQDGYAQAQAELVAVHKLDTAELRDKLWGALAEREKFKRNYGNKVVECAGLKVQLDGIRAKHELELVDAAENAADPLRKQIAALNNDRNKAAKDHAEAISNLETRIAQRDATIAKYERERDESALIEAHDAELEKLREEHKEAIEKLEEEHTEALNDLEAKLEKEAEEDRPLTLEEGFVQGIEDLVRCSTKTTFTLDDLQEIAIDKNHPLRPRF